MELPQDPSLPGPSEADKSENAIYGVIGYYRSTERDSRAPSESPYPSAGNAHGVLNNVRLGGQNGTVRDPLLLLRQDPGLPHYSFPGVSLPRRYLFRKIFGCERSLYDHQRVLLVDNGLRPHLKTYPHPSVRFIYCTAVQAQPSPAAAHHNARPGPTRITAA